MTAITSSRTGVARNIYYYPGDGFGYGYGFGIRSNPGVNMPTPPGSPGEIKWDSASVVYIVVDRAEDLFFVVMQNSPRADSCHHGVKDHL